MKVLHLSATAVLALAVANCATVTRGTTSQVQIVSEPAEAEARTSLGHTCTTPCTIEVSRKSEFSVVVKKDGYADATVPVQTRVAGSGAAGFVGNVLLGGVVGMAADAATGATLEHYPNPVNVTLEAVSPTRRPARGKKLPATSMMMDDLRKQAGIVAPAS